MWIYRGFLCTLLMIALVGCAKEPCATGDEFHSDSLGYHVLSLESDAQVTAIQDAHCVKGTLAIGGDVTRVELPLLTSISGGLTITSNGTLTAVRLPVLESIGAYLAIQNNSAQPTFETIVAPLLREVQSVWIGYNDDLKNIDFLQNVRSISGNIDVQWNGQLQSFAGLSGLETVGGNIYINNNPPLDFSAPALRTIGGRLEFASTDNLAAIALPILENVETLKVRNKINLNSLDLSSLNHVRGDFVFENNWNLATCAIDQLHAQVAAANGIDGSVLITNNDDGAVCN